MGESSKGASLCAESKRGLSPKESDDGLEKEFLMSWKFATDDKDALDFASEAPNSNKKKPFSFGKMDDFEFGDDFGKLSSFNIDMSDLDFPSTKKGGKTTDIPNKEASPRITNGKQDGFSFNFDFDELEGFGLSSNLLCESDIQTNKKETIQFDKTEKDPDSGNKPGSTFVVVEDCNKNVVCSDKVTISEKDFSEVPPGQYQDLAAAQKSEDARNKNEVHREQLEISQVMNSSNNHSMDAFPVQCANGNEYSEHQIKVKEEPVKSVKLSGSPDSRGSSSVKASDLKYPQEICMTEPTSVDKRSQSHSGDKKEQTSRSMTVGSSTVKKGTQDASISAASVVSEVSSKHRFVSKQVEDYQSRNNKVLVSSKHPRDGNFMHVNVKESATHLKATANPVCSEAPQSVLSNGRQSCPISGRNIEDLHYSATNQKSAVEEPLQKSGGSNSFDRTPATRKGLLDRESDTEKKYESISHAVEEPVQNTVNVNSFDRTPATRKGLLDRETGNEKKYGSISQLQRFSTNVAKNPISNTSQRNPLWNNTSGVSSINLRKFSSFEKPAMSSAKNDGKRIGLDTNFSGSKVIPEVKSEREFKEKMGTQFLSEVTSVPVLSVPPLKHKLLQGNRADPAFQNPLKQMSRIRTGLSAKTSEKVSQSDNVKDFSEAMSVDKQSPAEFPATKDLGVSSSVLDLGISVEKAKVYTKELDDICNTLKRKQEQAQELVVRAIVNRNSLLMLNKPAEEEKIRRLQRTTASLVCKYQGSSLSSSN